MIAKRSLQEILLFSALMAGLIVVFGAAEYWLPGIKNWIPIIALFIAVIAFIIYLQLQKKIVVQNPAESIDLREQSNTVGEQNILSQREYEVLKLIAGGLTNKEIAEQLFVSINTVKSHIQRIFEKLEVQNRTQAIVRARELKIL